MFQAVARTNRMVAIATTVAVCALLSIRPAIVTFRFLAQELAGRATQDQNRFDENLRAAHPGLAWSNEMLLVDEPLRAMAADFKGGGKARILKVTDYRDDWTAFYTQELRRRFVVTPLGVHPGAFPAMPTSTLLTYHTPPAAYYLVSGIAPP